VRTHRRDAIALAKPVWRELLDRPLQLLLMDDALSAMASGTEVRSSGASDRAAGDGRGGSTFEGEITHGLVTLTRSLAVGERKESRLLQRGHPQQLFGWRRVAGPPAATGTGELGPAFASVIVEGAPSRASVARPSAGSSVIEVVIGAMTVRVPPVVDVATLQAVLCAVKAMS
jgi:hypothetical protein